MIKLAFIGPQRKILRFEIDGRSIFYFDEIWKEGIKIMPKDQTLLNQLINSNKANLRMMAALILDANKGKNLKEYESCKTEEELADFVRKDCRSKGLMEVK